MMLIKKIKKNRHLFKKSSTQNGFVVLFAVVLSSILLAITIGIANVSVREIQFSTEAKDTNSAFFAADAGAECAFYNDKATVNSFPETGGPSTITCLGNTITLNGAFPSWNFIVSGLGNDGKACAKVVVNKSSGSNPTTSVVSKGYNIGGDGTCSAIGVNLVERELEATFISESIPIVTISADSTLVSYGSSTNINWTSTNATSCMATDGDSGWSGSKATSSTPPGYTTSSLTSSKTYSIQCEGEGEVLSNIASVTINVGAPSYATGGTITTSGAYTIHTFTVSGTFNPGSLISSVDVLVVAGGGAGAKELAGGGGGAGGVIYSSGKAVTSGQDYSVTVGTGGLFGTLRGGDGGNSTFSNLIAVGGGGGGGSSGSNPPYINGNPGGSGGGGGTGWGAGTGGLGTTGQGKNGGNGWDTTPRMGGGGGGAGVAGALGVYATGTGGKGGDGIQNSITGTATYYGGGGGGGDTSNKGGSGGLGGGGHGVSGVVAGTAGTGGGGGAGVNGGAGGSGIVIIRYLTP
jgi:hypothetical protein